MTSARDRPVLIVGAGVAGLSCALRLIENGESVRMFEFTFKHFAAGDATLPAFGMGGDHLMSASIEGAVVSGQQAADAVINEFQKG